MIAYGLTVEVAAIADGRPLTFAFFEKIERLVRDNLKTPPYLWDENLTRWDSDSICEVRDQFVIHLVDGGLMGYLGRKADAGESIDVLMVIIFKQYLSRFFAQKRPYQANLRKRVGETLNFLHSNRRIEKREPTRGAVSYRKEGSMDEFAIDEDRLDAESGKLPAWKPVFYAPDSLKISPLIRPEDLLRLVSAIFDIHSGWIRESTLQSFLSSQLRAEQFEYRSFTPLSQMEEELSSAEWLDKQFAEHVPKDGRLPLKLAFQSALDQLSSRQQDMFWLYYLEGRPIPEIASFFGVQKSVVYAEIGIATKTISSALTPGK